MTVALLACVLVTLATLFYVFYLPGELHLGRRKPGSPICASARKRSMKICAT